MSCKYHARSYFAMTCGMFSARNERLKPSDIKNKGNMKNVNNVHCLSTWLIFLFGRHF